MKSFVLFSGKFEIAYFVNCFTQKVTVIDDLDVTTSRMPLVIRAEFISLEKCHISRKTTCFILNDKAFSAVTACTQVASTGRTHSQIVTNGRLMLLSIIKRCMKFAQKTRKVLENLEKM